MDYEFTTDPIYNYSARFSMGHEAIGNWLTMEISDNPLLIDKLFAAIQQLQHSQIWEYLLEGNEYAIELSRDEASVRAHSLFADAEDFDAGLNQGFDYYDSESAAQCGLTDFTTMLQAWCQFIGQPRQPQ
tara:strand:+ start:395 stop:784 length:390 start_codon:yes stop_codon:yes gene_type:complete